MSKVERRFLSLIGFLLVSLLPPGAMASTEVGALYGQSDGFWNSVEQLRKGSKSLEEIANLLDSHFRNPQEGVMRLDFRFESPAKEPLSDVFSHGFFGGGFDYLAGGYARNRIYPELRGYSIYSVHADTGFRLDPAPRESGFHLLLKTTLGVGDQYLAQGAAVDFVDGTPTREAAVFYWGVDLGLGYSNYYSEEFRSHHRLTFKPTLFHSDLTDSGYQYQITEQSITPRWKLENEWVVSTDAPLEAGAEMSLLLISGQQPIPVDVLPRTWDSIHQIKFWPSAGQLVGLGSSISLYTDKHTFELRAVGGFFGGYLGGEARLKAGFFTLRAGTFGLEQTSGYRVQQSRIQYLSAGVTHAF